jgi:hypothetical protein
MQACDLWLALMRAWHKLQQDSSACDAATRPLLALRAVQSAAGLIGVHYAARREIPPELWRWLHQAYFHAERHHLAESSVAEEGGESACCATAYAEALLVDLAYPYGLARREHTWMQRWARRWAAKVKLWRSAENGGGPAVDLDGDNAPKWTAAGVPGAGIRYIDCSDVLRSIRRRLRKLREGADPAQLGLGRDCIRPATSELLSALARCWGNGHQPRQFPRRKACSPVKVVSGLQQIYQAIAERPFGDAERPWDYSRRAAEQLHIFQRAIDNERTRERPAEHETWETVDESANGFQLRRKTRGERVTMRQLLGMCTAGAHKFILCEVRWLRQAADGTLSMGVKALPGLPQACALRPVWDDPRHVRGWVPAFLLPHAEGVAPTLAVPAGVYGSQRQAVLKQENGKTLQIRFSGLLRHGDDFDWIDFAAET